MAANEIETFYRQHADAVLGYLVSMCRDRTWAEDLMQDTFVKATRSLGGYRGGNPKAWLFTIARTVFIDDTRRRRPVPTDSFDNRSIDDPDVAEQDLIERTLALLPERQRTALLLSDRVGLDAAAVGEALGITPGAARVLIHRARAGFRLAYEGGGV